MAITPEHLQGAGVAIIVLIAIALLWWLARAALGRPKRGQVAYWLLPPESDEDNDDPDDVEGGDR